MTQAHSAPAATHPGPNFELLKDAYQIIDGIPEVAFALERIFLKKGESLKSGTIACAAGWLSTHPQFRAMGLGWDQDSEILTIDGCEFRNAYSQQMAQIFNLPLEVAQRLFNVRGGLECSKLGLQMDASDKEVFLKRLWRYLESENALTPKVPTC